jgi:trans-aconitate methyltransferase
MLHSFKSIQKIYRHVVPRSKERYFSLDKWNDSWGNGYDLNRAHEDARYATLVQWMCRYEGDGPLLDVGCGDGLLEEHYRKISSMPVMAFDYSETAVDHAKARRLPKVEFSCEDSRSFRTEQRFSLAILNESLYYVDGYLLLMNYLAGLLKPGGLFLVSMHDHESQEESGKIFCSHTAY